LAREQEKKKKKGMKSKQKITPKSAEPTFGSPKKRNQETLDLNPSPVIYSKLCKEMVFAILNG
jgi:hypothetical protein